MKSLKIAVVGMLLTQPALATIGVTPTWVCEDETGKVKIEVQENIRIATEEPFNLLSYQLSGITQPSLFMKKSDETDKIIYTAKGNELILTLKKKPVPGGLPTAIAGTAKQRGDSVPVFCNPPVHQVCGTTALKAPTPGAEPVLMLGVINPHYPKVVELIREIVLKGEPPEVLAKVKKNEFHCLEGTYVPEQAVETFKATKVLGK